MNNSSSIVRKLQSAHIVASCWHHNVHRQVFHAYSGQEQVQQYIKSIYIFVIVCTKETGIGQPG